MSARDSLAIHIRWPRAARALAAIASLLLAGAAQAAPHLSRATGEVQIGRGEPAVWQVAHEGAALGAGDAVRTGSDGRAEVDLGTAVVRVYENSLLRLPVDATRPEGPAAVGLDGGSSLFQVTPRPAQDPFEVRTPEVVASVKGTRFGVDVAAHGAAVSVFSGQVGVRGSSGANEREVMVYPGFAATGGRGRAFELSLVPAGDAWEGWSEGAPAPASAGKGGPSASSHSIEEARAAAQNAAARDLGPASGRERAVAAAAKRAGADAPAAIDPDAVPEAAEPERTPVDRVVTEGSPSARPIQEQVVGAILNGTAPVVGGNPAAALGPLSVQVLDDNGPDRVVVSGSQGVIGQVTQGQINSVIQTGSAAPLGPQLAAVIANSGVDPVAFAKQLSSLLH